MTETITESVLEARDLTKHFHVRRGLRPRSTVHAVENVSLALPRSSVTAVVGESGSGKSTLARMLARIITPTSGELLLDGQRTPTGQRHRQAYAGRVQLVLQDPFASLNPVHSIRYHLARPLKIHNLAGDDLDEAMEGLLRRVALDPPSRFIDKYPHELSGGQRQRVAIARALAVQPDVLLADEPVSMLDVSIRVGLLNLMAQLRDTEGVSFLYITHDLASARYVADLLMVMYAGQIAETGPTEEVLARPKHPYTQLLLTAVPDPRAPLDVSAKAEVGEPPKVIDPQPGCRFRWRCPLAIDKCQTETPPLRELLPRHQAACHVARADEEVRAFG